MVGKLHQKGLILNWVSWPFSKISSGNALWPQRIVAHFGKMRPFSTHFQTLCDKASNRIGNQKWVGCQIFRGTYLALVRCHYWLLYLAMIWRVAIFVCEDLIYDFVHLWQRLFNVLFSSHKYIPKAPCGCPALALLCYLRQSFGIHRAKRLFFPISWPESYADIIHFIGCQHHQTRVTVLHIELPLISRTLFKDTRNPRIQMER